MPLPAPTPSSSGPLCALIYLGPSSLSLLIADKSLDFAMVDFLMQPIALARDIFRDDALQSSTISRCIDILKNYKLVLQQYGGESELPLQVVSANILSEARNKEVLSNRIEIALGWKMMPLDDGEMTRLIYLKTQESIKDIASIKGKNLLITHVGPGNTRILTAQKQRIIQFGNYRLGTHRTGEVLELSALDPLSVQDVIKEHIRGQLDQLSVDTRPHHIEEMIVIGYEIQNMAVHFRKKNEARIPLKTLKEFAQQLCTLSLEERVLSYNTDYAAANALVPSLVINIAIAEALGLDHVYIPRSVYDSTLMRDLLILRYTQHKDLEEEVLSFANTLADRYLADKKHRHHVCKLAEELFDQLAPLHKLSAHDKLLLRVAATLHEIGTYITQRQHHKHARYIISNTDIFGLNSTDVDIVSLLVSYHRHELPSLEDPDYRNLSQEERLRVSKMAALLRIAVGLDRAHAQRLTSIKIEVTPHALLLKAKGVLDTTIEEIALTGKADLFEQIFGLPVRLSPLS